MHIFSPNSFDSIFKLTKQLKIQSWSKTEIRNSEKLKGRWKRPARIWWYCWRQKLDERWRTSPAQWEGNKAPKHIVRHIAVSKSCRPHMDWERRAAAVPEKKKKKEIEIAELMKRWRLNHSLPFQTNRSQKKKNEEEEEWVWSLQREKQRYK